VRLCFDVDATVADPGDPPLPYADRAPYPYAVAALRRLKAAGHRLIYLTARYMERESGSQARATERGWLELRFWLDSHQIPWDEIYLGKPSADVYFDDRGRQAAGEKSWQELLDACKA
jgi:hypothetical protein